MDLRGAGHGGDDRDRHRSRCGRGATASPCRTSGSRRPPSQPPDRSGFLDSLAGSFDLSVRRPPRAGGPRGDPAAKRRPGLPAEHLLTAAGTVRGRAIALTAGSFAAAGGAITLRAARVVAAPAPGRTGRRTRPSRATLRSTSPTSGRSRRSFGLPPLQGALDGRAQVSGKRDAIRAGAWQPPAAGSPSRGHRVGDVVAQGRGAAAAVERRGARGLPRRATGCAGAARTTWRSGTVLDAEADVALADVAPYLAEFVPRGASRCRAGCTRAACRRSPPGRPARHRSRVLRRAVQKRAGRAGDREGAVQPPRTAAAPRIGVTSRSRPTARRGPHRPGDARRDLRARSAAHRRVRAAPAAGGLAVKGEGTLPVDLAADDDPERRAPSRSGRRRTSPPWRTLAFLLPPAYALDGHPRAPTSPSPDPGRSPSPPGDPRRAAAAPPAGTRFVPPGPYTLAATADAGARPRRGPRRCGSSRRRSRCSLSGAWSSPPPLPRSLAGRGAAATGSLALRAAFSSPDIGWLRDFGGGAPEAARERGGRDHRRRARPATRLSPARSASRTGRCATRICRRSMRSPPGHPWPRRRVTLEEFAGNVGGSPFTLAGLARFLPNPDDPALDLRLQGTNALLYRDEGLRVRADSDLTLRGPVSALSLAGEMALTDSLYQKTFSVATSSPAASKEVGETHRRRASPASPSPSRRCGTCASTCASPPASPSGSSPPSCAAARRGRTCGSPGRACCRSCAARSSSTPPELLLPSGTLEFERGSRALQREGHRAAPSSTSAAGCRPGATRSRPRSAAPSTCRRSSSPPSPPCPRRSCCSS